MTLKIPYLLIRAVDLRLESPFGDSRLDSSLNPCMTRDLTQDSTRMTRRVCIILKFIVVLRSAARHHRHVEIWK